MRIEDVTVEVADKSLARQSQIVGGELNLEATIAHNETGLWTLKLPRESAAIPALSKPGSRVIITTDSGQFLSGPRKIDETEQGSDDPAGTVTFTGTTDNVLLKQRLAYPQPANADAATQTDADWKMTGTVEAVMHALVSANLGPNAPTPRRDERLVMGANLGRGPVISVAARFEPLHDVLSKVAAANAFTFNIAQRGDVLVFETAPMVDRSAEVRLSVDGGSLASSKVILSAPGVTHVIVGGEGAAETRTFSEMTTTESLQGESLYGERIERYVDAGTGTPDEIKQPALDVLKSESNTGVSTQSVPAEDSGMAFGVDYFVGDQVAVEVDGQEPVSVVSGAILKADAEGVRLQITLGDALGFDPLRRAVSTALAVVGKVNRIALKEIPFAQIDVLEQHKTATDDALDQYDLDLATANEAIVAAQENSQLARDEAAQGIITAANDATAKANTAETDAIAASGKTIWQPSAPTGANATVNNLWIDTTVVDGNPRNWPMRWNPASQLVNKWECATDYTALSAVIAAGTAQSRADLAYDSANGKNKITSSLTVGAPATTGRIEVDTHWTRDSSGRYIAQYEFRSGVWVQATYGAGAIADAAIVTSKIAGDAVTNAALADAAVQTAKIADAAIVEAKIGALAVTNAKIADATIGYAKIASVDLGTATVGQLHGSYIAANSITATQVAADTVTAMLLAGDRIRVGNPAADHIDFYSAGLIGYAPDGITPKTTIATSTGKITAVGGDFVDMLVRGTSTVQGILTLDGSGVLQTGPSGVRMQFGTSGLYTYPATGTVPSATLSAASGGLNLTGSLNVTGTSSAISAMNTTGDGVKIMPDATNGGRINFYSNNIETGHITSDALNASLDMAGPSGAGFLLLGPVAIGTQLTSGNGDLWVAAGANLRLSADQSGAGGKVVSISITNNTTASAANMFISASSGIMYRSTSSARYKQDIQPLGLAADAILGAEPVRFHDRGEVKRYAAGETWVKEVPVLTASGKQSVKDGKPVTEKIDVPYPEPRWIPGFIAEQLHDAGLGIFVQYDEQGRPDAISDSRLIAPAISLLRDHNDRLADLTARLTTLEGAA